MDERIVKKWFTFDLRLYLINLEVWKMKSVTTKQAEKWLEKVRSSSPGSFKEINKILKKYERTNDEHECFIKLNTILLQYPDLTHELNNYMDEEHKFVINRSQVERINDLVKHIKKVDPRAFNEIVFMITSMSNQRSDTENPDEEKQNNHLISFVLEQVKDNSELSAYANKALYFSAEELIQSMDLSHLRTTKKTEVNQKGEESYQIVGQGIVEREQKIESQKVGRKPYVPFLNQIDEKAYLRKFQSQFGSQIFQNLVKIIEIYQIGIISKDQALKIIKEMPEPDYSALKDIIQCRETDRRRNCVFRPLGDMDFSNYQRASHSYVKMPDIYPHYCSESSKICGQTLNREWVSVPRGSEDTFNIRFKNTYEQNLIKGEDDRYQFDIYLQRLRKSIKLLDSMCEELEQDPSSDIKKKLQLFLCLGIPQILYKNFSKEQKEEFEYYLAKVQYQSLNLLKHRLNAQNVELKDIRNVHGLKNWQEVAGRNFIKSLDIKGHQFKRTEKLRLKGSVFLEELKRKVAYLRERGEKSDLDDLFSAKKDFFTVLNSFQTTSRKQCCLNRNLPTPQNFELHKHKNNSLLPAIILAFEDQWALSLTYSFLIIYLENSITNETEKARCRYTIRAIISRLLKFSQFQSHELSSDFDEELFFDEINGQGEEGKQCPVDEWILKSADGNIIPESHEDLPKLKVEEGAPSYYDFLPPKTKTNVIFYGLENFYVFLRFFYTLYERLIRMREVLGEDRKVWMFELLYFACIKSKESSRFEQSLNSLFGNGLAYIFTTFYKLVENLCKSLNSISTCLVTSHSLRFMESESEAAYIQLLNNYILNNSPTVSKLVRCAYDEASRIMYINYLDFRYICEDNGKELPKRRAEISKKIQLYTVMGSDLQLGEEEGQKEFKIKNGAEYFFEGNSIKLVTLSSNEDILISCRTNTSNYTNIQLHKTLRLLKKLQ